MNALGFTGKDRPTILVTHTKCVRGWSRSHEVLGGEGELFSTKSGENGENRPGDDGTERTKQ